MQEDPSALRDLQSRCCQKEDYRGPELGGRQAGKNKQSFSVSHPDTPLAKKSSTHALGQMPKSHSRSLSGRKAGQESSKSMNKIAPSPVLKS